MKEHSDTPVSSFGSRLKKYRKAQGISAEALADKINEQYGDGTTTRSVITAIETGRKTMGITLAETLRFAHALQISPLVLIIDCEQPFLTTDFPGFNDGIPNYIAQRRFSGTVRFTQSTLPECMAKAATVGHTLDIAVQARHDTLTNLASLKTCIQNLNQAENTDDKSENTQEEISSLSEDTFMYASQMYNCWERFTENRSKLLAEGVIIPEHPRGIGQYFTESAVAELKSKIVPYERFAELPELPSYVFDMHSTTDWEMDL